MCGRGWKSLEQRVVDIHKIRPAQLVAPSGPDRSRGIGREVRGVEIFGDLLRFASVPRNRPSVAVVIRKLAADAARVIQAAHYSKRRSGFCGENEIALPAAQSVTNKCVGSREPGMLHNTRDDQLLWNVEIGNRAIVVSVKRIRSGLISFNRAVRRVVDRFSKCSWREYLRREKKPLLQGELQSLIVGVAV